MATQPTSGQGGRGRGNQGQEEIKIPEYRARRWVVERKERTHSWMNRFRRLLIRWEKKEEEDFKYPKNVSKRRGPDHFGW